MSSDKDKLLYAFQNNKSLETKKQVTFEVKKTHTNHTTD